MPVKLVGWKVLLELEYRHQELLELQVLLIVLVMNGMVPAVL